MYLRRTWDAKIPANLVPTGGLRRGVRTLPCEYVGPTQGGSRAYLENSLLCAYGASGASGVPGVHRRCDGMPGGGMNGVCVHILPAARNAESVGGDAKQER